MKFLKLFRRYEEFICQYELFSSIFIDFLDFLKFSCYKESNDIRLSQMMSVFCHFQHTLNRLFNTYIKLYKILEKFFLKYEGVRGRVKLTPPPPLHLPPGKNCPSKRSALLGLNTQVTLNFLFH